ncbi:MAG: hypothetical protein HQK89_08200 [Nitrospirae bacterium]|nr:hypothetical protein [Nitrospirota bacterium]
MQKFKIVLAILTALVLFTISTVYQALADESPAKGDDKIIATVSGYGIKLSVFERYLKTTAGVDLKHATNAQKEFFLNDLIAKELIALDAEKSGMLKEEKLIENVHVAAITVIKQYYTNKMIQKPAYTDSEIEKYYNGNLEKFVRSDVYNGTLFYVYKEDKDGKDVTSLSKSAAEDIKKMLNENKSGEEIFKSVTEKNDKIKINGSSIEYYKGKYAANQDMEKIMLEFLKLNNGDVNIIEQPQFYAVMKMDAIVKSEKPAFKAIKSRVASDMEKEQYDNKYQSIINDLTLKYKVVLDQDFLKK